MLEARSEAAWTLRGDGGGEGSEGKIAERRELRYLCSCQSWISLDSIGKCRSEELWGGSWSLRSPGAPTERHCILHGGRDVLGTLVGMWLATGGALCKRLTWAQPMITKAGSQSQKRDRSREGVCESPGPGAGEWQAVNPST